MFTPLQSPVRSLPPRDTVRMAHYVNKDGSITVIKIPIPLAAQVRMIPGGHVNLLAGTGDDAGLVKIELASNGTGYKLAKTRGGGRDVTVITSLLRPNTPKPIPLTSAPHTIAEDALILTLPAEFVV